jgi:hypothetical protein
MEWRFSYYIGGNLSISIDKENTAHCGLDATVAQRPVDSKTIRTGFSEAEVVVNLEASRALRQVEA